MLRRWGRKISVTIKPEWKTLHLSWVAFFLTFVVWFSMAPFLSTIGREFGLSTAELTGLMVANLALTIPARIVIGTIADRYGPRRTFAILLWMTAIPVIMFITATSYAQLIIARVLMSMVGAGFVVGIRMMREWFPPARIGLAEGIYAGFGNFGSSAAALALPTIAWWFGGWRLAIGLTGLMCVAWGCVYWKYARDVPSGKQYQAPAQPDTWRLLKNKQLQVLAFSYFVTFGGELAVVSMLPSYMESTFGLTVAGAGVVAGSFSFMNLFARPAGGWLSDAFGRVRVMLFLSIGLTIGYLVLASMTPVWPLFAVTVAVMLCSFFVQAGEGAAFSIAPFVDPKHSGQIAGMIGACGNLGAVMFLLLLGIAGSTVFFLTLGGCAAVTVLLCRSFLVEPEATYGDDSQQHLHDHSSSAVRVGRGV